MGIAQVVVIVKDNGMLPLPRGVKPHIMPRYDCPPNSVYHGWNRHRLDPRYEIICPMSRTGRIWGGFKLARELWNPWRNRGRGVLGE